VFLQELQKKENLGRTAKVQSLKAQLITSSCRLNVSELSSITCSVLHFVADELLMTSVTRQYMATYYGVL
jgi:hypothetical protein